MSKENLEEKIITWLSKTGYSMEMRVVKYLISKGLDITQSDYYVDFETNKKREIDITTRTYEYFEPPEAYTIAESETFAQIECKSHQKQPWVLFKSAKNGLFGFETPLCNREGRKLVSKLRQKMRHQDNIFNKMARDSANGVTQAFHKNSGQDIPYKAIMGALKASEGKALIELEEEKNMKPFGSYEEYKYSAYIFPIVVTDARLFEVSLTKEGETSVIEVEFSAVAMRYPRRDEKNTNGTIVYIFRESSLSHLAKALNEFQSDIKKELPHSLKLRK